MVNQEQTPEPHASEQPGYYRRQSELLLFNDVEPLPETPISDEARQTLLDWGFEELQIRQLQEFCASFYYTQLVKRIQLLAREPVYVTENKGVKTLNFPFYSDITKLHGQCGDLAFQAMVLAKFTGLLSDFNEQLQLPEGHQLVVAYVSGQSKTHFNYPNSLHAWNGLGIYDQNQQAVVEWVQMDVAFQQIQMPAESGYKVRSIFYDFHNPAELYSNVSLKVRPLEINSHQDVLVPPNTLVLGLSEERKYAYSMAFAQVMYTDTSSRLIGGLVGKVNNDFSFLPIISRIAEKGYTEEFFIHPITKKLVGKSSSGQPSHLESGEKKEILTLLEACSGFTFSENSEEMPLAAQSPFSIKWNK